MCQLCILVTPHCVFHLLTDKLLKASKLAEMSVGGGAARLTLPHLAKDDEGLYTLRIFTKDGTAEHSAYLFVSGRINLPASCCILTSNECDA